MRLSSKKGAHVATPSDLSCCGLISQIKVGPDPRTLKVVMIVHGGALERARALDLGADDVMPRPAVSAGSLCLSACLHGARCGARCLFTHVKAGTIAKSLAAKPLIQSTLTIVNRKRCRFTGNIPFGGDVSPFLPMRSIARPLQGVVSLDVPPAVAPTKNAAADAENTE